MINLRLSMLWLLFWGAFTAVEAQLPNATGCIPFQRDTIRTSLKSYPVSRGDVLPVSFSLKEYCPRAGNQGQLGSCAAWATAYAGLTIVKRIESGDASAPVYSPYCQYARYKASVSQEPCSNGSPIQTLLQQMSSNGCGIYDGHGAGCFYEPASRLYDEKLFDFDMLEVSTHTIQTALASMEPVVISIRSYKHSGWESVQNHVDGVWNGTYVANQHDGFHAMCIVGYDDYRGGGSFLVLNSWGPEWGDNGYFWLRYEDLFHVNEAYAMVPLTGGIFEEVFSEERDKQPEYIDDQPYGHTLRMVNQCSAKAYFAFAYLTSGGWKVFGWRSAEPGGTVEVRIHERLKNEVYWYAETATLPELKWYDSNATTKNTFCFKDPEAFDYDNGLRSDLGHGESCSAYTSFHKIVPERGASTIVHSISCPSYTSRGGKDDPKPGTKKLLTASNSLEKNNYAWDHSYELIDLSSGRIITPQPNDMYEVWFTDGKSKPSKSLFSIPELEGLRAYKFSSEGNAEMWMEYFDERKKIER